MRHTTPDLEFIVKLYQGAIDGVDLDRFYSRIRHIRAETPHPCVYMNEVLSLWGHQFNYDEDYLRKIWSEAGFQNIKRAAFGQSGREHLCNLEQHGKTEWFRNGFTLIMEAQKPPKNSKE